MKTIWVFIFSTMIFLSGQAFAVAADLIVTNAKITTLDQSNPVAQAVAVKDGVFVEVGSVDQVMAFKKDDTLVIDANGRRMIPGLNDSHLHPTRGARFYNLELRWDHVKSLKQGLQMIKEQAERTPEGQWVRVIGGWTPNQFKENRMPTIAELNKAAPNTPVFVLYLYSMGFLNQAGMDRLGIDENTKAPWGSRYERNADGKPTGVLIADPNPMILYKTIGALPHMTKKQQINSAHQFYTALVSFGLTSVIDAGGGGHNFPKDYSATNQLASEDKLPLRVSYYLFPQKAHEEYVDFKKWIKTNTVNQNGHLTLSNGYTLEGGGEFLVWSAGDYENFMSERPELKAESAAELTQVVELLVKNKWPLRVHATYDETIGRILDIFERVNVYYPLKDIRWAFDHAETVSIENLQRIKKLGGGIAIQNRMAYAGEDFVDRYGKDKAKNAPPIHDIIKLGIPVGAGTDGTRVSSFNPWHSLYWLVSGKTVGGLKIAAEQNQLSREKALELFTAGSAWFSGEEHLKGRIRKGMYADFALLTRDFMKVDENDIKELRSVFTVVGGRIKFGAEEYSEYEKDIPRVQPDWSPVAHFEFK
jgi:predicted amidohydrolase YtcJ